MKNKMIAILTAAIMAFSGFSAMPVIAATAILGDLNCDGKVTIADAVLLHRLIAEDDTVVITVQGIENADCDSDGVFSLMDVHVALEKAAVSTTTSSATTTTTTTITTTKTTATPAVTTVATTKTPTVTEPDVPSYTQVGALLVSPYPFVVQRNEEVTLNVIGLANTEYDINVYYSSGVSKASGLENKTSDNSGYVSWTWKIGGKTNSGNYHVDLIGGVTTPIEFSVVD